MHERSSKILELLDVGREGRCGRDVHIIFVPPLFKNPGSTPGILLEQTLYIGFGINELFISKSSEKACIYVLELKVICIKVDITIESLPITFCTFILSTKH